MMKQGIISIMKRELPIFTKVIKVGFWSWVTGYACIVFFVDFVGMPGWLYGLIFTPLFVVLRYIYARWIGLYRPKEKEGGSVK